MPTQTDRLYGLTTSVAVKPPCRVKTTGPIVLRGLQVIDGVAVGDGNRVLVGAQPDSNENGIYLADTSDWNRATDFDGSLDVVNGTLLIINEGSGFGMWRVNTIDPAVVPHPMTFSRFIFLRARDIPVDPIPGLAPPATNVQEALEGLETQVQGITLGPIHAINVLFDNTYGGSTIAATEVQHALQELDADNQAQNARMDSLQSQINALSGGSPVVIPVGTIAPFFGTNVPAGWLFAGGGTIGNASSGADTFANAAALPLYAQLYNSSGNNELPVNGGRTGNAVNDFNASKWIRLPDLKDRTVIGWGNAGRVTTSGSGNSGINTNVMGHSGGSDRHQQSVNELASHTHPVRITSQVNTNGGVPASHFLADFTTFTNNTTDSTGQNNPMTIMQPSYVSLWMIKW